MAKRAKKSESDKVNNIDDRISTLPKHLLYHVLSFLPMCDVVRTCVLAKTWKSIWCSVPTLEFRDCDVEGLDHVKFVNSLLILRDGSNIKKFRLYLHCDGRSVNEWITYAVRHNVEVLDILHWREDFKLTSNIFTSESLRELKLYYSNLDLPASICLPGLVTLHLLHVVVQDGQLDQLLSSATSLETFTLEECSFQCPSCTISTCHLKNLNMSGVFPTSVVISAPNLLSLKLIMRSRSSETIWNNKDEPSSSVVISAPNLVSLNLDIHPPATIRFDSDLFSLADAIFNSLQVCRESMTQLISVVKNARSLTLSSCFISLFARELQKDISLLNCIQTPFHNLKWLKIGTYFKDDEMTLINSLLEHSPEIESLFLGNTMWCTRYDGSPVVEQYEDENVLSKYKLSHLKLVEVQGFQGSANQVKIVKFFLENAIVLEELIIMVPHDNECTKEDDRKMRNLCRKLLTYPRASARVGILFEKNLCK